MNKGLADARYELVVDLHNFYKLPAALLSVVLDLLQHLGSQLLVLNLLACLIVLCLLVVVFEVVIQYFLRLFGVDFSRLRHYFQTLAIPHSICFA